VRFVVGVDGGGTRTRAVILDDRGVELGRAEARGRVATAESPRGAAEAVAAAVRAAAERARVDLPGLVLWAGLAGAGRDDVRDAVRSELAGTGLARDVHVGTDVEAAFHDAFGDGPGLLLIAGTGSIGWGRAADGRIDRVGGWGERLGDEGSGYAIGLDALRAVVRASDGRDPATRMSPAVLAACGMEDASDLVGWIERAAKSDVAALVPIVVDAAARLDPAAAAIVERAVAALDRHVATLLERAGPHTEPLRLVLWGGLIAEGGPLRSAVREAVQRHALVLSDAGVDPPRGAARLALGLLAEARR